MTRKTRAFDPADHLRSEDDMAAYITLVLNEGEPGELAEALGIVARARGMTQMAKDTGLGRETLYKALRADAQPRFDTVARVCKALGVKLVAQPLRSR